MRVILIPSPRLHRLPALIGLVALVAACGGTDGDADTTSSAPPTTAASAATDADATPTTTADAEEADEAAPSPIATTTIWADITSSVLCGLPVAAIVPIGADPHTFEAPIAARADIAAAGFVVANGLDLEEGLIDLLDTVEAEGITVVHMTDHVAVIESDDGDDDHAHEDHADDEHADDEHADDEHAEEGDHDGHDHAAGDPHIWLDPMRVAAGIDAIVDAAVDAGHDRDVITPCAEAYRADLVALDADIASLVDSVPASTRNLVTNHDALGYFADRYGFTVIGTVIPSTSTMAATNPADLADLAELIAESGVTTIFTDAESSDIDATALADRLDGVQVVPLLTGSLTSGTEDGRDYVSLMRTNAQRIVAGSGGTAG